MLLHLRIYKFLYLIIYNRIPPYLQFIWRFENISIYKWIFTRRIWKFILIKALIANKSFIFCILRSFITTRNTVIFSVFTHYKPEIWELVVTLIQLRLIVCYILITIYIFSWFIVSRNWLFLLFAYFAIIDPLFQITKEPLVCY